MSEMNEREYALEILEDEEDIREGLKALADDEGTIAWEDYSKAYPSGFLGDCKSRGERI